jgi:germination protein M
MIPPTSLTPSRRMPTRHLAPTVSFAMAVVALLAAACGPQSGDLGGVATRPPTQQPSLEAPSAEPTPGASSTPNESPGTPPTEPTDGTPTQGPTGTTTVRAYFFLGSFVDNAGLVPVLREIPRTQTVGAAAMAALLAGPNDAEMGARPAMYTSIPDGTRFLGLTIDGGIATVNLSREFESGGGSASVLGRLAQVVYTLTQFPTVSGVRFQLDGAPVTVFSGEGVVLQDPVDRSDYHDQLPAIFVDRPAWGGVLGNPARLVGLANVFEATFHAGILDGGGHKLADGPVMATCGTGCWGTFDVTLPYRVTAPGWGTLQVYELSAADGSVVNLTEYPVWLTP